MKNLFQKLLIASIASALLFGLVSCGAKSTLRIEGAAKVTIMDRVSGEKKELTDSVDIQDFTDTINHLLLQQDKKTDIENGYYELCWYKDDGTVLECLDMGLDGTFYRNGYIWTPTAEGSEHDRYWSAVESKFNLGPVGFLTDLNKKTVTLDEFEFIYDPNDERARELGLTADDFPNGYRIYDPEPGSVSTYPLAESCVFEALDWDNSFVPIFVDGEEMAQLHKSRLEIYEGDNPYGLILANGEVQKVVEIFTP